MTYWAFGCVQKCDLWAWLRKEKKDKLSCVKLAICPDHPRRHRPLKFCMRGRIREVVIYFKFHENRSRGLGAVGGEFENRPLPLTRPMAYTTACTSVQAVIPSTLYSSKNRFVKPSYVRPVHSFANTTTISMNSGVCVHDEIGNEYPWNSRR